MKKTLSALMVLVSLQTCYAQWSREWSLGYAYSEPAGKMKNYINRGNGVVMSFHLVSPSGKFSFGADLNHSIYGFDKSRQEYMFSDGTTADMDIHVSNSFTNAMASGRYHLLMGKKLIPYVEVKAGYSWFTTDLSIFDPDDSDSCEPVENDLLYKDGTLIASVGGGLKYDLVNLFKRMPKEFIYVNVSANFTQGGAVRYMSTDAPIAHHSGSTTSRASDVEAAFVNTQTQIIHKHHVGYLYSSFAQMMDFRLSFIFRPSQK